MPARLLRLRAARVLEAAAARVRPPSPCEVRDWCNAALCNGTACPTCGTWEHPTGPYRPERRAD